MRKREREGTRERESEIGRKKRWRKQRGEIRKNKREIERENMRNKSYCCILSCKLR